MADQRERIGAFEFVTIASARARQLLKGSVPRVEGPEKPATLAQREVAAGLVKKEEVAGRQ